MVSISCADVTHRSHGDLTCVSASLLAQHKLVLLNNASNSPASNACLISPASASSYITRPFCISVDHVVSIQMSKFLIKLSCLSRGDLVAASLIHTSGAGPRASAVEQLMGISAAAGSKKSSSKKGSSGVSKQDAGSEEEEEAAAAAAAQGLGLDGDLGTGLGAYEAAYGEAGSRRLQQLPLTCHIQDAMRIAVAEFFARMPSTKCQNCGCTNPAIRKQGSTKLFKQYTRKSLLQNSMRGINVAKLVGSASRAAAEEVGAILQQAEEAAAAAGKKRKRSGESAAEGAQQQQHEDEQAKKKGAVAAAAGRLGVAGFKQQQDQAGHEELEDDLVSGSPGFRCVTVCYSMI